MDNFFSSSDIFDDMYRRDINYYGLSDKIIEECIGVLIRH